MNKQQLEHIGKSTCRIIGAIRLEVNADTYSDMAFTKRLARLESYNVEIENSGDERLKEAARACRGVVNDMRAIADGGDRDVIDEELFEKAGVYERFMNEVIDGG